MALNAGELITEVLEIVENGMQIAVLDASAACHMPDVLEMPYRPPLKDAGDPAGESGGSSPADSGAAECARPYVYRLAGPTCLAGDDRRLHLCTAAEMRRPAGIPGYGDLYDGEDKYI